MGENSAEMDEDLQKILADNASVIVYEQGRPVRRGGRARHKASYTKAPLARPKQQQLVLVSDDGTNWRPGITLSSEMVDAETIEKISTASHGEGEEAEEYDPDYECVVAWFKDGALSRELLGNCRLYESDMWPLEELRSRPAFQQDPAMLAAQDYALEGVLPAKMAWLVQPQFNNSQSKKPKRSGPKHRKTTKRATLKTKATTTDTASNSNDSGNNSSNEGSSSSTKASRPNKRKASSRDASRSPSNSDDSRQPEAKNSKQQAKYSYDDGTEDGSGSNDARPDSAAMNTQSDGHIKPTVPGNGGNSSHGADPDMLARTGAAASASNDHDDFSDKRTSPVPIIAQQLPPLPHEHPDWHTLSYLDKLEALRLRYRLHLRYIKGSPSKLGRSAASRNGHDEALA
eukprot:TRINITY_DN11929_c2_g3_i4.p1 TRINITY_DN11929_c2_g3~~TRINITY_DN11929_c2_g3_i4.p1  ORF type:complete len:401 (+),score=81.96 TRINITY_DN11929_c2_g3_i4:165-1367(+)